MNSRPKGSGVAKASLVDRRFLALALTSMAFFFAQGMTFPVLPRLVKDEFMRSDAMVGLAVSATAIGAVLARGLTGYIGDTFGRRILMLGGALTSACVLIMHLAADSMATLMVVRVLYGLGQGAFMVGATTSAVDLAPEDRRGEATSYIFVALHLGSGSGPILGEWVLRNEGFDAVWVVAGLLTAGAAALTMLTPGGRPAGEVVRASGLGVLHPAGVLPGMVLGLGILGFIGFNSFAPLFGDEIGVNDIAPVFMASSFTIVFMRSFGGKWPDRLGPVRGGTVALLGAASGLAIIGTWQSGPGLFIGAVVMSAGISMLLPSLVSAAVEGVPVTERSAAMGTYTLFMEISAVSGALMFGVISGATSYGTAFITATGTTLAALVLLHLTIARRDRV